MNALIFKDLNESKFLPFSSPKAHHIKNVLNLKTGDEIFAGIKNQNLYKTRIFETESGYEFSGDITPLENPKRVKITLCSAFTRPQIAKRIMFEASCFGIEKLIFYPAQKGESGYLKASLYSPDEVEEQLIKGAEQACSSLIPEFHLSESLQEALELSSNCDIKIAPDIYESTKNLSEIRLKDKKAAVVFGGERGFSNDDRTLLRENGYILASLGKRVLRTDSAIIATLAIIANGM